MKATHSFPNKNSNILLMVFEAQGTWLCLETKTNQKECSGQGCQEINSGDLSHYVKWLLRQTALCTGKGPMSSSKHPEMTLPSRNRYQSLSITGSGYVLTYSKGPKQAPFEKKGAEGASKTF